jgi:tRNA pseudouridine32 synthase / 23S rRNA pseudouridine746 synthase
MPNELKLNDIYTVEILYEDQNLISVNKPTGLASITENDIEKDSLHSLLEEKLGQKLFVVHRLDKEVSGVILYAKNANTHKIINYQFNERTVKKHYVALVHGIVKENDGIIKKPIREFGSGRMGVDERKGKRSETNFHVIERFKNFTLLELNPTTGRRHQLRVHLYSIGFPIVGDLRYGEKTVQENYPRIMLHAKSVELELPAHKRIFIEAAIPDSFTSVLNKNKNKNI